RTLIRELAIRGKLVEQGSIDGSAKDIVEEINRDRRGVILGDAPNPPYSLPHNWTWTRFNSIASIESNLVNPDGYRDLPHIAPNNIEKGTGRLLPYGTVGEDGVMSSNHLFREGQLLYSKIRPNLSKVVIVDF